MRVRWGVLLLVWGVGVCWIGKGRCEGEMECTVAGLGCWGVCWGVGWGVDWVRKV